MTFIPHTDKERRVMLDTIGVDRIEDLFSDVPQSVRFPILGLPPAISEMEVMNELSELSDHNMSAQHAPIFLGAGAYNHYIPSVVDHILRRGEFFTAYTPYQPEISQGTLQVIFEYQTMICALTGMEVSNASHYDGGTALAEAVIMAVNVARGRKKRVVLSSGIHPQYRQVVQTYTQGMGLEIVGSDLLPEDIASLLELVNSDTAILAVQTPNFLGQIEDMTKAAATAHDRDALFCVVANPISLGLFKSPGEYGADIVTGEGQPLGIPLNYGGPYLGYFATKEKFVRKMSGRIAGQTVDTEERPGFVLTLSTREQHIRREKATSNICSNQGLMTLAAAVYLSTLGKCGLRKVAELNFHKAHYAAKIIDEIKGFSVNRDKVFFNEFMVKCPLPVRDINRHLLEEWGIIGGYDLGRDYPHLANHMLVAVTEVNTSEEIDDLAAAMKELVK